MKKRANLLSKNIFDILSLCLKKDFLTIKSNFLSNYVDNEYRMVIETSYKGSYIESNTESRHGPPWNYSILKRRMYRNLY